MNSKKIFLVSLFLSGSQIMLAPEQPSSPPWRSQRVQARLEQEKNNRGPVHNEIDVRFRTAASAFEVISLHTQGSFKPIPLAIVSPRLNGLRKHLESERLTCVSFNASSGKQFNLAPYLKNRECHTLKAVFSDDVTLSLTYDPNTKQWSCVLAKMVLSNLNLKRSK